MWNDKQKISSTLPKVTLYGNQLPQSLHHIWLTTSSWKIIIRGNLSVLSTTCSQIWTSISYILFTLILFVNFFTQNADFPQLGCRILLDRITKIYLCIFFSEVLFNTTVYMIIRFHNFTDMLTYCYILLYTIKEMDRRNWIFF